MTPGPPQRVAVLGGNRIPFARQFGPYAEATSQDMLTAALDGLVARFGLAGERLGEVVAGAVVKHSRDLNLTREAVLSSALAPTTPAYDVQQACGTGLQATILLANKIALGQIDAGVSGGVDSASDAPITVSEPLRRTLLRAAAGRGPAAKAKALAGIRPTHLGIATPTNGEPRTGLSMGEHMAITARDWGVTREDQDALAAASHQRLAAAYDRGFFDDLITPYLGLTRDQNLRPDSTPEKLATLRPAFGKGDRATLTAGNSTPLTDGASTVLLATDRWAQDRGLRPLAYVVDGETAAVDFVTGRDGLLTAPVFALPRLLARTGMRLQDFALVEIHEAFAATVLTTLAAWESAEFCRARLGLDAPIGALDSRVLNVNGSSLAAGHPFAATGGRIVASLAKMLHEKGTGARGLISICAAGGQGVLMILEAA